MDKHLTSLLCGMVSGQTAQADANVHVADHLSFYHRVLPLPLSGPQPEKKKKTIFSHHDHGMDHDPKTYVMIEGALSSVPVGVPGRAC